MNKTYITLLVLVVVVGGGFLLWKGKTLEAPSPEGSDARTGGYNVKNMEGAKTTSPASVKEFTVTGSNYAFSPKTIAVKKGDTVKINFVNAGGFHNLIIDEFNVATKTINGGASDMVEFVADKTGSFQYYCGVGNHRAMGMWGTLTVE